MNHDEPDIRGAMLKINRILFPTDFSEVAERAFLYASSIADRFDAELHVVNVVVPGRPYSASPMDYLTRDLPDTDAAEPRYDEAQIPVIHAEIEDFSPTTAVLGYVKSHDIDLIVMGTHGRSGVDRIITGSIAEDLVRHSSCPVLTLQASSAPKIERVLVPVDFSDHSRLIVTYARELAAVYGAQLYVLHVVEDYTMAQVYGFEPVAVDAPEVLERVRANLQRLVDEAPGADVAIEYHVVAGNPVNEITRFADEIEAGLIVTATHGHTGIKRFLLGSVTERVVRSASCPVFTVKSFGKHLISEDPSGSSARAPQDDSGRDVN